MYPLHLLHPSTNPDLQVDTVTAHFCSSWLIWFRQWQLCLYLALGFSVSWNINTALWSALSFLTRKVVSGILHPYISDKTTAQKSEISKKINVYSYRRAHRCACCSGGVMCRGCGVVTCNIQLSIEQKRLGRPWIAGILYSSHIVALDLFFCHCRRCSYLSGIRLLKLCQSYRGN